jgi:hypothetical protein
MGLADKIILLTSFSIYYSYSLDKGAKCVISRCALCTLLWAPFYQTCGPNTFLHAANTICVAVWWFLNMFLLSKSTSAITYYPTYVSAEFVKGLSMMCKTDFPTF